MSAHEYLAHPFQRCNGEATTPTCAARGVHRRDLQPGSSSRPERPSAPSTAASSARSSSTSAAASTTASTSRATRPPTPTASARTCSRWCASSASSTVRYPGGNFVSGYRWEDGVGPREERPTRLDLAWHSTETNQVGLDEFARWSAKAGSELMLAVNLGTRGVLEALDLLEYTNIPAGTALLATQRVANGRAEPLRRADVVPRQRDGRPVAARPPSAPTTTASSPPQTAKAHAPARPRPRTRRVRQLELADADLRRVGARRCSSTPTTTSTSSRATPTTSRSDGDLGSFLASARRHGPLHRRRRRDRRRTSRRDEAQRQADQHLVRRVERLVLRTATRTSTRSPSIDNWPVAPRLLEDVYTVADAVVVGSLLISLLNHADRVQRRPASRSWST